MTVLNIERRDRICDAAIEVLANEGLRGLTHRAVDAGAEVPLGTTSRYFRSRESLLRGVVDRVKDVQFAKLRGIEYQQMAPAELAGAIAELAHEVLATDRSQQLALHELYLEGNRRPYLGSILTETSKAFEGILVELCRNAGIDPTERDSMLLVMLSNGIILTSLTTRHEARSHLDELVRTGVERILVDYLPARTAGGSAGRTTRRRGGTDSA